MGYEDVAKLTEGYKFPVFAKNADNENVIIERGRLSGRRFFRISTSQNNGWMRYNTFWEDGSTAETYRRSNA